MNDDGWLAKDVSTIGNIDLAEDQLNKQTKIF